METPQYCIKKTPEDAQREMEELTRREIIKLTEKIAQNPEILRHKFMGDSDDESSCSSSLSDDTSSVESSESESNALVIYKKEQEIDKLSEKNYYKSLEMNNLMIENQHLKDELNKIMVQNRNNTRIIDSFKKLFEYKTSMKSSVLNITEGTSIKEITESLIEIQSKFIENKKLLSELEKETDTYDEIFQIYFTAEIQVLLERITKIYDSNYELLNTHINKISEIRAEERAKEIVSDNKLAVGITFALFIFSGFLAQYFFKQ